MQVYKFSGPQVAFFEAEVHPHRIEQNMIAGNIFHPGLFRSHERSEK